LEYSETFVLCLGFIPLEVDMFGCFDDVDDIVGDSSSGWMEELGTGAQDRQRCNLDIA
jgi:hypothetical protein